MRVRPLTRTTLITFIGRTEANRGYRAARYRFSDDFTSESKLFAVAALEWLRRTNRSPERILIIGTPTSGWDVLTEVVERFAPERAEEAFQWALPVSETLSHGAVDESCLRDFERRFTTALGFQVQLARASNDGDSVFEALDAALPPSERVILDITHSFRSMPVHALVALGALRWLKQVEVSDILYGALDERDSQGFSAARSLGATAALALHTPALAQLALVDDVGQVASFFAKTQRPLADQLSDLQRLESTMQFDTAKVKRGQALGALRGLSGSPIERAVSTRVRETLESLNHGSGSRGLINRAKRALNRRDFMRALGLANEAIALRAVECYELREEALRTASNEQYYATLTDLVRKRLEECAGRPECLNSPRLRAAVAPCCADPPALWVWSQ